MSCNALCGQAIYSLCAGNNIQSVDLERSLGSNSITLYAIYTHARTCRAFDGRQETAPVNLDALQELCSALTAAALSDEDASLSAADFVQA